MSSAAGRNDASDRKRALDAIRNRASRELLRRRRREGIAAVVLVEGEAYRPYLEARPPVGATIDVGFPVMVTESKTVAGGGLLIAAVPVDNEARPTR